MTTAPRRSAAPQPPIGRSKNPWFRSDRMAASHERVLCGRRNELCSEMPRHGQGGSVTQRSSVTLHIFSALVSSRSKPILLYRPPDEERQPGTTSSE
ncbi:hypothetical protein BST61_g3072 [Cercospora zeina]